MRPALVIALATPLLAALPHAAFAYIGPGAGISLLGSVVGVIVAILLAIGAVLLWPIRRMMKRRRQAAADTDAPGDSQDAGGAPPPANPG